MSIVPSLAQAVEPIQPAADPLEMIGPGGLLCIGLWLATALAFAAAAGVFTPARIVGPDRYGRGESAWRLLKILAMGIGASVIGAGLLSEVVEPGAQRLLIAAAAQGLLAVVVVLIASTAMRRRGLELLGIRANPLRGVSWGLAGWMLVLPAVYVTGILVQLAIEWLDLPPPEPHPILEQITAVREPQMIALLVVLAVVVAPLSEELLFRGLLQTILVRFFQRMLGAGPPVPAAMPPEQDSADDPAAVPPPTLLYAPPQLDPEPAPPDPTEITARWMALVAASILFALVHIEPAFLPPLFVLSMAIGYVYERTGNLWAPIALHALFNGSQIVMVLLVGPEALQ